MVRSGSDQLGGHAVHPARNADTAASPAGAGFGWNGNTYTGFAAYRAAAGQDPHSSFR